MRIAHSIVLPLLCAVSLTLLAGVAQPQPARKKLIEYGWDVPHPSFVAKNIREMEKRPFDGLIMRLPKIGRVFVDTKYDEADVAAEIEAIKSIKWDKFTDNFLCTYAASTMDWFSDADWECVLHNVGLSAKAARAGRCKGLCFDAEPYGNNPWLYATQTHAADKTFAQYQTMVRKRGAQFMAEIQKHLQNPVIHTFFLLSYFRDLVEEPDAQTREAEYAKRHYGLLPAFLEGMLDAASPGAIITDGNESAYYYTNQDQYEEARDRIRNAWKIVSPANQDKYRKQVQCSQALYVDQLFNMRTRKFISAYMTPEERARWFQHNVYHALSTADEYVWLYSEKMNWWTNTSLPPGLEEAVVQARRKTAQGRPLGYDLTQTFERANERQAQALRAQMVIRQADVMPIQAADAAPAIDGQLGDAVWKRSGALDAFAPYVTVKQAEVQARTLAWLAYDEDYLYVAIECLEPKMDALQSIGAARDQDIWLGDSVDVFLAPGPKRSPYFHIILNPDGARWDAHRQESDQLSWNPEYQSATYKGADYWTLEMAVPWSAMDMSAPKPGDHLFANICRQRMPSREHTSWSQCISGFVEPGSFGTLIFR